MSHAPHLLILENADVYAPEHLGACSVWVAGGRILAIEPLGARVDSGGAGDADTQSVSGLPTDLPIKRFDCGGRRLVPGFMDAHAHITGGGGEDGASTKVPPPWFSDFTTAGVTSVVGLLGTDDVTRATAELLAGVRALRELGLSAWCWTGGYHLPPTTLTGTIRGDIVHLDAVIGAGEIAISDHRSSQLTLEDMLRVAGDCHVGGMLARKAGVMHLHLGDGTRGLELINAALDTAEIPARVFQPTHVNRRKALLTEAFELAARGCHIDVTAFPVSDGEDAYSAEVALQKYLAADLPPENISISSDGGGCLPVFDANGKMTSMDAGRSRALPETLARAVELGVPLEAALPAMTSNVAEHLRLTGKGRVRAGFDADLVLLDDAGGVSDVWAGGDCLVQGGDAVRLGVFESEPEL